MKITRPRAGKLSYITIDQDLNMGNYNIVMNEGKRVDGIDVETAGALFGGGIDEDIEISTDTTLTRDMYYNKLSILSGATLFPDGYVIYVREKLVVSGTISRAGRPGGVSISGGDGGVAHVTRTVGGSGGGGKGGERCGGGGGGGGGVLLIVANKIVITTSGLITAKGGKGGNGCHVYGVDVRGPEAGSSQGNSRGGNGGAGSASQSGHPGASGGTATKVTGIRHNILLNPMPMKFEEGSNIWASAKLFSLEDGTIVTGGAGGGGGGQMGGHVSGTAGGGGGGGGGVIILLYNRLENYGSITAAGGEGGAGYTPAAAGSPGEIYRIKVAYEEPIPE